jgi:L-methionine (R)-S-oxide reductase
MNTPASSRNDFIENLVSVSAFVEERSNLDNSLLEFCAMVAKAMNTANCSIMLLKENQPHADHAQGELQLRVQAHFGILPAEAYATSTKLDQGIAGKVAKSGKPMLIEDIATFNKNEFNKNDFNKTDCNNSDVNNADNKQRGTTIPGGFISFPIVMEGSVIGVINVNSPLDGRVFQPSDLELANILSLFIAKSIQTLHLKNLLQSKFAIAALAQAQAHSDVQLPHAAMSAKPEQLVKILAKSFYQNLRQVGLGDDHILKATTEIIDLLLQKTP